jgi:UDP-GlcNAc:undecaprenyl-phosphate/decaprenyl-phosphate GlcNAc-1-phosphate transferase
MTLYAFLTHILFALSLFVLSCIICKIMIGHVSILDIPNDRSSHDKPIPKSGGVAIVVAFLIGVFAIYLWGDATLIKTKYFMGVLFSALLIAAISFYDDLKNKPFVFKLLSQLVAVFTVLAAGIVLDEIHLPGANIVHLGWLGYLLTFFWILGLTNAYNFMDGLNGMAGGNAIIVSLFFCILSFYQGSTCVYIICYTLISGTLGFMVFNFPRPRLFMGDVGSAFLGFVFATLAIIAALYDHSHTSFFVIPLLLFHFIYDTVLTFIRRFLHHENVFTAHRTHLYQLFHRLGHSHIKVSSFYFAVCIAQGLGAVVMLNINGGKRLFIFVPFLVFQIIYSMIILRKAKKAALI